MPLSNCSRHDTCVDCILARDPYCAWDFTAELCSSVHSSSISSNSLQSLTKGDVSQCPQPGMSLSRASFACINQQRNSLVCSGTNLICVCVNFRSSSCCGLHPHSREQHPAALPEPLQLGAGPVAIL